MINQVKSIVRSIALTIFNTLFFLVLSCDKKGGPNANFINQINFKKVQFMDLSKEGDGNIVRWEWSFGDNSTSTEEHPLHIYSEKDIYSVNLVVTDNNDFSDSITKEVIIPDTAKSPTIGFSYNQSSLFAVDSFEVTFTDNTENGDGNVTSWSWDFGDGNSSIEQNSVHLYTPVPSDTGYVQQHFFTVSLSVTDEFGFSYTFERDSIKVNNPAPPTTFYSYLFDILTVSFTSFITSDGEITNYHWDFGDATTEADTSDLQSPTYTYPAPGIYPVSLTVIDSYGLSAGVTTDISVYPTEDPPSANFSWAAELLQVIFTDLSVAGDTTITNWSWDFGDGTTEADTSDLQSPTYTYTEAGTYSVSLTVTDANELSNLSIQNITVAFVLVGPTAGFTHSGSYLTKQFTDESTPGDTTITNWSWDFDGDGNEDTTGAGPHTYVYEESGTYSVSLTVTDENNLTDTYYDSVISVEYLQTGPSASFEYSINNYTVTFTDISSEQTIDDIDTTIIIAITSWNWDFGDGNSSIEQNSSHNYASEGIYNVSLTVTDANGLSDSHSRQVVLGINFMASINVSGGTGGYDLTFGFSPVASDGFDVIGCIEDSPSAVDELIIGASLCLDDPQDPDDGYCSNYLLSTYEACILNNETWYSDNTWATLDIYAPAPPPPPAFDAALGWDGDRYFTQILAGLYEDIGIEHIYDIQLQYSSDNLITITWDNTVWSNLGSFILQDAFGGVFINVNMIDGSGTVNEAFASLDNSDPSHPVLSIFNTAVNTLKLKVTPAGSSGRSR